MILLLATLLTTANPESLPKEENTQTISEATFYGATGSLFEFLSFLGTFWQNQECQLFSQLCSSISSHLLKQLGKTSSQAKHPLLAQKIPASQLAWYTHQAELAQIPPTSEQERQTLSFLQNRFLAKAAGFFPFPINWIYPCFGLSPQIHPQSSGSYARSPFIKISPTYKSCEEAWKQHLPHPYDFPLILTRPCCLKDYFPSYLTPSSWEEITSLGKELSNRKTLSTPTLLDLSHLFSQLDSKEWKTAWERFQGLFLSTCREHHIDLTQVICIQTLKHQEIGGIRVLPLALPFTHVKPNLPLLIQWISTLGLSANPIELDRGLSYFSSFSPHIPQHPLPSLSREDFLSYLTDYPPSENVMVQGVLSLLSALLQNNCPDNQWEQIKRSSFQGSLIELYLDNIHKKLEQIKSTQNPSSFFEIASYVEQIHGYLSSLLEILSPFLPTEFSTIYASCLSSMPKALLPLSSYGLHASGMTSIAGILRATQKLLRKAPYILYGNNTYYECINAFHLLGQATSIQNTAHSDWEKADLLFMQFNPVWKGSDPYKTEYKVEDIAQALRLSLQARKGNPVTLALDCTFDFIDSPRVASLLEEFQCPIEQGILNIICYRSGLKFDIFGMDNYAGAPFYMIHSRDSYWDPFHLLLTDPVLQTDSLSLNWFCLAYQNAAPLLDHYRQQISQTTKALLQELPLSLFDPVTSKEKTYRVIPIEKQADPFFIDITIQGPFHQIRSALLASSLLYFQCLDQKLPIFSRISIGFYHTNFTLLFGEECSTIRLTLGPDPAQIPILKKYFQLLERLNSP